MSRVRRIIFMMSVSLDGFMEGPDRELDWQRVDAELHGHFNEWLAAAGAFLDGRVTYELMAGFWPTADRDPAATPTMAEFARIWREMPKIVYSRSLDPGTLGLTGTGDPAAAGGSPAEQAAVGYALSKGVVLVAPAGDDGQGLRLVNYPAAYPGVIAVGAIGRTGQLASFSSRQSYTSLTAPGVGLVTATQPAGYGTMSSTSTASGIVAGLAALVLSRFPHLTVTQVTQALTESTVAGASGAGLPPLPARSVAGAGYGTVDAIRAVDMAAIITTASQPHQQPAPVATPHQPARHAAAAPRRPAASTLAGSLLRDAVAAVAGLIVLLVIALLVARSRRKRSRAAAPRPASSSSVESPSPGTREPPPAPARPRKPAPWPAHTCSAEIIRLGSSADCSANSTRQGSTSGPPGSPGSVSRTRLAGAG